MSEFFKIDKSKLESLQARAGFSKIPVKLEISGDGFKTPVSKMFSSYTLACQFVSSELGNANGIFKLNGKSYGPKPWLASRMQAYEKAMGVKVKINGKTPEMVMNEYREQLKKNGKKVKKEAAMIV